MSFRRCLETAEDSWQECTEERDQGHSTCSDWDDRCCDWWPCSWGCKLITWICVVWVWISNIVCVAWKIITVVVCVLWEVISVVISFIAIIVDLILAIPFIGRFISELLNIITEIIWRAVNLVIDLVLGIFGLDLVKYMRVGVVILKDEKGNSVANESDINNALENAKSIYKEAANIELILEGLHTVGNSSPSNALHITCDISSWGTDLGTAGSYFEWQSLRFWDSRLSRTIGLSSPITVFAIKKIDPDATQGCSLGPATDYVLVEGGDPVCFAHELGHACGLILPMHNSEEDNLNNATCGGTKLTAYQRTVVRSSRHVTYF